MRFIRSLLIALSLMFIGSAPSSHATSIGFLDPMTNKFVVKTKFFFYGPAVDEKIAKGAVEEISRLWNQPKVKYFRDGIPYPIEFRFEYAVNNNSAHAFQLFGIPSYFVDPIRDDSNPSTDKRITQYQPLYFSKTFPITIDGYVRMKAVHEDPNLNVIKMVHAEDADDGISNMVCGDQMGEFVIENAHPKGTTFAHEFGHSLGLPHALREDCVTEHPSVMCARGSATLPKYQYDAGKKSWEKGGSINPIYRTVRAQDILTLNISKIRVNDEGFKLIGPHMKKICQEDHSSI